MKKKKYLTQAKRFFRKHHINLLYVAIGCLTLLVVFFGSYYISLQAWKEWQSPFQSEPETPSCLKIGFTNDWEYGTRKQLKHKLPNQAVGELQKTVDFFNNEFKPDIVIGGGDYIESSAIKKEKAKIQLAEINEIFKTLEAPRLYALGNHDMRSLTKAEVREILEMPENHAVQDIGEWRIIVLDTNFNKEDDSDRAEKNYVLGYVSRAELEWLYQALDTERPVIVFTHHSPISPLDAEGITPILNITNEGDVRTILEARGNVVAVVSGHTPQSYYEERNGIHYFIVDTMVNQAALGSFATIELEYIKKKRYAEVTLSQKGARPANYTIDWHHGEREEDILPEPISGNPEQSEDEMLRLEE